MFLRIARHAVLALAFALLSGCGWRWSAIVARPEKSSEWDSNGSPRPHLVRGVVGTFQQRSAGLGVGCGAIVHSCVEHGTFVLTAHHCVEGPEVPGVWLYDDREGGDSGARMSADELRCFAAEVVVPGPLPEGLDEETLLQGRRGAALARQSDAIRGEIDATMARLGSGAAKPGDRARIERLMADLKWLIFRASYDFALLRLATRRVYPPAAVYAGGETSLPTGTSVVLASVNPEGFPHVHEFAWSDQWPEELFKQGHSGSPILHDGAIFALVSQGKTDSRAIVEPDLDRPSLVLIREVLRERGLAFVLDPSAPCRGSVAPERREGR